MRADLIFLTSGAISFAGHWKEEGDWPSAGVTIIGATLALAVLASMTNDTPLAGPVKGFAGLALLATAIRYVPTLSTNTPAANKRSKKG